MTKLDELLYSLTSVLVRYHDSQSGVKKLIIETDPHLLRKKSRACAIAILLNKEIDFKTRMGELIKECTNGYPARSPFLFYILHEITFLNSLHDKTQSFSSSQLEDYKNQLTQLLIDLKQLLTTTKGTTYNVKYSETGAVIALSGLTNDSYLGNSLCNSGLLIKEEILDTFNISASHSNEEIKVIAEGLCSEHQNTLLIPELQNQLAQSTEQLQYQQETIALLTTELQATQEALAQEKVAHDALKQSEALANRFTPGFFSFNPRFMAPRPANPSFESKNSQSDTESLYNKK